MIKPHYLWCFFLLLSPLDNFIKAQILHHQMISSQGTSTTTSNGVVVNQSIGQQSVIGTSSNSIIVQQGFQQNFWQKYLATNVPDIKITTYPNPFDELINFQFSSVPASFIQISIFDIRGRLVFNESVFITNNLLTIELPRLPNSEYLVKLTNEKINYFTKIIKR